MSELGDLLNREMLVIRSPEFGVADVHRRRLRRQRNRRIGDITVGLILAVAIAVGLLRTLGQRERNAPAVGPPTGTIVFSRQLTESDGDYLFTIAPDGSRERQLIKKGADEFIISPDGMRLLIPNVVCVPWSECVAEGEPSWALPAAVDLDGTHRHTLRPTVPIRALWPSAWAPDGSRILATGRSLGSSAQGLYSARSSDAGDLFQITSTPDDFDIPSLSAWSPDGSKVLFLRSAPKQGLANLFTVNVDGSGLHRLNQTGVVLGPFNTGVGGIPSNVGRDKRGASWSPDGTQVVFAGALGSPQDVRAGEVPRGLFVVNADGTDSHQIVSGEIPDAEWSPDGRWIAFTEGNPSRPDVFIVHPDGSGLRPLTSSTDGLASWGPVWSPDGSWLLISRSSTLGGFDSDLWIVGVDGSHLSQMTHKGAEYFSYGWSPATVP